MLTVINEALEAIMERPLENLDGTDKTTALMVTMGARVRQDILRRQDWTCARNRVPLVEITHEPWTSEIHILIEDDGDDITPDPEAHVINYSGYDHVFAAPTCLRVLDVVDPVLFQPVDRLMEGARIYTDEAEPIAIITQDLEDPTAWDNLLRTAIVYALASRVVFTLTGQQDKVSMLMQIAEQSLMEAKRQSLSERGPGPTPSNEWFPGLWERTP